MRILITDDSAFMRAILKNALQGIPDLEFLDAENGDVAVELYRSEKPDLVFLDIIMPVKNGIMALEEIRQINNAAKVVIVTSLGQEEMITKAKELGADGFISKPFQPAQIQEIYQRLLATSAA